MKTYRYYHMLAASLFSLILCREDSAIFSRYSADFTAGVRMGRTHKNFDSLIGKNRFAIGSWFSGSEKKNVEEAILITPAIAVKLIGYDLGKGEIDETQMDSQWAKYQQFAHEKSALVLRLARLCRVDPDDGDLSNNSVPENLDKFRVQIRLIRQYFIVSESKKKQVEESSSWSDLESKRCEDLQDRKPELVLKNGFDVLVSHIVGWKSMPASSLKSEIRWGKNRLVSEISWLPDLANSTHFDLRIIESDRTRQFRFPVPKS
jgi:hypothetical protein